MLVPTIRHYHLLSGERLGVSHAEAPPPVVLTAVNDDMLAFPRQHLPQGTGTDAYYRVDMAGVVAG